MTTMGDGPCGHVAGVRFSFTEGALVCLRCGRRLDGQASAVRVIGGLPKAPEQLAEFLALAPRDRDAYLARAIMGWTDVKPGPMRIMMGVPPDDDLLRVARGEHYPVPAFTTEASAAVGVVDRLRGCDWRFASVASDLGYRARFYREPISIADSVLCAYGVSAATLAEAITGAAVAALAAESLVTP